MISRYLRHLLILTLLISTTACSTLQKVQRLEVFSTPVERAPIPMQPPPAPVKLRSVEWYVVTEDTYDDFKEKLVNYNLPIVSGIYKKTPDIFACCGLDGRTLTVNDIEGQTDLIEVKANGMGFMLVKREVLDYIVDPFEPIDPDQWEDFTFQEKARLKGFKSYIDPTIIVGHEKKIVL